MTRLIREFFSAINSVLPKSLTFKTGGQAWKIPYVARSMDRLMRPGRESETGEWVKRFFPNANFIIDIGANVGQSLIQYRSLYPDAEYIGFEPNPVSSSMIVRLIAMNGLQRCKVFTVGIGPEFRSQELLIDANRLDDPTATVVPDCHGEVASRVALPIIMFPLQHLLPDLKLSPNTLIKIDVEGFEVDVLESLGDLADHRPTIVSEVLTEWHGAPEAHELYIQRMHAWLDRHDYSIVAVGQGRVDRISDEFGMYLFVPSESKSNFMSGDIA
jgi:FkbM family methyltransferase